MKQRIMQCERSWTVDLDKQNLTDRDMSSVVKCALVKNHCKRLRLRDNRITCDGAAVLADGLHKNTTLESFDLRNNEISDVGVQHLAPAISSSHIKTLNLESNQISAQGAQHLAKMLQDNDTLTELYLSKNHLGDHGVQLIADALSGDTIDASGQSNQQVKNNTRVSRSRDRRFHQRY